MRISPKLHDFIWDLDPWKCEQHEYFTYKYCDANQQQLKTIDSWQFSGGQKIKNWCESCWVNRNKPLNISRKRDIVTPRISSCSPFDCRRSVGLEACDPTFEPRTWADATAAVDHQIEWQGVSQDFGWSKSGSKHIWISKIGVVKLESHWTKIPCGRNKVFASNLWWVIHTY
jgi:hypothetical protein